MKSVLVTGLCTLHWGRLQYGNIGNYYIMEPLFRQLHQHFEGYEILTTFQMDNDFVEKENVVVLPMELYYAWNEENDLKNALLDVEVAQKYVDNIECELTPYVKALLNCEYVINVSGDMWGDNAEHVGHNRFWVDCLKMKTAQILKKKTILYAVTPGPFTDEKSAGLAKEVFAKFDRVIIREKVSKENLVKWGFPTEHVVWAPCPSYLFEPNYNYSSKWTQLIDDLHKKEHKAIGITFGGFNMPCGPYDMWPRAEEQYQVFVALAEYIIDILKADIVIFSHTNGFKLPPEFELINGRDFVILEQFYQILIRRNANYREHIILIDEPLLPCDIKRVMGKLDMLVTGRVHASVAATSQCIPTVYIEYDRNVIYSDKMTGFSAQLGMERFVCTPGNLEQLKEKVEACYNNLGQIRKDLEQTVPDIKNKAISAFKEIRNI